MDNLTHALVGAAISKAGAERTTPLATATLVIAANAPDVDMVTYFAGEYTALAWRRGITHGVPALLVLPFLVAGIVLAWDRRVRRRRRPDADPARPRAVLLLAAVGLLTHPTLDWMNTYGMRWWLPFDASWSYGDALFIIDPWLWLLLGGGVFLAVAPRGWGREAWAGLAILTTALIFLAPTDAGRAPRVLWGLGIALLWGLRLLDRPRSAPGRRLLAASACSAVASYILAMVVADVPARARVLAAATAAGLDPEDVMVAPLPARPFASEVEVRTPDAFVPGSFRWLPRPEVALRPEDAVARRAGPVGAPAETVDRVISVARAVPEARRWLVWSRYPYVRVFREPDGWRVRFADARYDGRPGAGGLAGVEVWVDDPVSP